MFIPLPSQPLPRQSFKLRAVHLLIIANILVFVSQLYAYYYRDVVLAGLYGAIPLRITHLDSFFPPLPNIFHKTLITSLFLHDVRIIQGGFVHLIGNMLYLSAFGPNLENRIGTPKFILFYLLCGALSTLFYVVIHYSSDIPLIGASGAIAGIMGAHFLACPNARVRCFFVIYIVSVPAKWLLIPWIAIQAFNTYFSYHSVSVAWLAHLGGFGVGIFFIKKFQQAWLHPKRDPHRIRPNFLEPSRSKRTL